ncbi:MAG: hypothetical protein WC654_08520 [Patescibacteria group bacterium]
MDKHTIRLIEKITRAKVALEKGTRSHAIGCLSEDPHMAGPCTCGADEINKAIGHAIRELSLDDL